MPTRPLGPHTSGSPPPQRHRLTAPTRRCFRCLAGAQLLILDDWGLAALDELGRHDLLEVLDDRNGRRATLVTSQIPVEHWHDIVGDAICDGLVHNAHRITLEGNSIRRVYD